MGVFGTGLYDNDTALDVKDMYENFMKTNKTRDEISEEIKKRYLEYSIDEFDSLTFWIALADTEWDWGRLTDDVLNNALVSIKKDADLTIWNGDNDLQERKKELERVMKKITSPQPPYKKVKHSRLYKCDWKIGDTYAYRIECQTAIEKGFFGRYFLIRMIGDSYCYPGHLVPKVYIKITDSDQLPTNTEEYDRLEYVQRFFINPINFISPTIYMCKSKEEIEEIMSEIVKFKKDDAGKIPIFKSDIEITSKKQIPEKLFFIGNFSDAKPPEVEYDEKSKGAVFKYYLEYHWVFWGKPFDEQVLEDYLNYNLGGVDSYKSRRWRMDNIGK